ncbi:hypothetical protein [Hymenobacter aerophilus]|uniref:hypothetical protein n=1 Tax=Hymenobacter aerophilus TaxID=119644 RepID=UPI00037BE5D6|nr:hypothetical protein [Hymenobacter aerophilus]
MNATRATFILGLLLFIPFVTMAQKAVKPRSVDLSNRTFIIGEQVEPINDENNYRTYFIFYKDGKAIYRGMRGDVILKDSPVGWQFAGDSLSLLPGSFIVKAEGKTQIIERDALRYSVKETPTGYLLQGKGHDMILTEVK